MPLEYVNHLGQQIPIAGSDYLADEVIPAALQARQPLSIVRMSDGEEKIFAYSKSHPDTAPMLQFSEEWRKRFGIDGISCGEMYGRLSAAARECTYFAPDGGEEFFLKHFPARLPFAEIYFPHRWTRKQRVRLLQLAGTIAVVNRDLEIANRIACGQYSPLTSFQRLNTFFGYLPDWRASEACIKALATDSAPLVLVSAGPASKYIIPRIAQQGKVVLDMGSGAPHFWCTRDEHTCGSAKHCGAIAKED